jgi:hypothetical protein
VRAQWWTAPAAVLLVVGGMATGAWWAQYRLAPAPGNQGQPPVIQNPQPQDQPQVSPGKGAPAFVTENGKLYLTREGQKALVADLAALPAQFRPLGAGADVAFGVGKQGWAVHVLSQTGTHVFWSTRGLHPLLGVSRVQWGQDPQVTPVDLIFEGAVTEAAWAPGGTRYVAVAASQPSGATNLLIYDLQASHRFGPDLGGVAGSQEYAVTHLRWDAAGKVVTFDLVKEGRPAGTYRYDIATRTLTPV